MSIVIHFNPAPYIPTVGTINTSACLKAATAKLEMAPGIKHDTDGPVMTDDSSIVDLATSNTLYVQHMKDVKAANHHVTQSISCCFGLPYQDHNYGAPPPPTPPSYSPCPSPVRTNGMPEEETNLSVVPASNVCEETHEGSVTRCVCGFEHDDEYMICCDRCLVWQHVDCMGLDRNNMPDTYMCEKCEPRKVDRHKAKVLQARKKVAMTDSSDSDDNAKNSERRPKTRNKSSRRKKEEDKGDEKSENVPTKRSRNARNGKERMEIKRSKLRRNNKNKESTSTADEEAQDAWEYSVELCDKHFEAAINNQYTPEVQLIARTLQNQCRDVKSLEQLQVQLCQVDLIEGNRKRLFAACDIPRGQPLIEYKGKFLLTSQFYELNPTFNKRLYPYVLFYSLHQDEICVDASLYGNDARFIRRSCKPNSEICHAAFNGNVHLYISSTKEIFKDEEITIPFDFCHNDSIKDIDCACEKEFCVLRHNKKNGDGEVCERKRRLRRFTSSADDDSSHSLIGLTSSPVKSKQSPVKNSSSQISPVSTSLMDHMDMKGTSDQEPEEQANERRRKMTREERKIDAIMRAFDQMEKAAKRRQQALDRMAQQRGQHPLPKSEEKQEAVEKQEVVASPVKEEEKPALLPPPPPTVVSETSETSCVEEEKPLILTPIPKPKKGKRRRGSGTQTRRRTRTNSGGSDIMSSDEKPPPPTLQLAELPPLSPAPPAPESYAETLSSAPVAEGPPQESCVESPQTPVLKTKRLLLQEWMHEKSETTPPACSSLQTEVSWTAASRDAAPTCYVRCTKDGPNAGGILAHHLRRSSSSGQLRPTAGGGQGSAKKRWLRQAMYDCNTPDELSLLDQSSMEALSSPLHNGCLSPNSQGEANSPGVSADDVVVTPLKKRRLMRESIESMPSPKSPSSIQTSIDWTTSTASCQSSSDSKTDLLLMEAATDSEGSVKDEKEKVYHLQIKTEELLSPKLNGLRDDLFMKSLVTSCESNDMKIEVTSIPVANCGNVSANSGQTIDIDKQMLKTESASEKIQEDICLDVSQNSCCVDNEIVDANIVPVEKTKNSHTFSDNLNALSTNSKNSVATSKNTSPLLCNQTSHKNSHHHSELTFRETECSIALHDCKVEHLMQQQCVEEQSTAQTLDEENLTSKLCEGAHFAMKQCGEEHLAPELHAEEKSIAKQNTGDYLTIKLCVEEILAPKLCVEENLAPKLCVEENFLPKLCEEENIIIKTKNEGEHLTTKLCEKEHLAPKLCEEEHVAPKPCEEEKIVTKLNEGEHSTTKLFEGDNLTVKMCGEEHVTHPPCEVEHSMKQQSDEEYLTVKQCGKEIETPKLHVEDHSKKQLEENLSLKECENESLISVNFHKKSSDDNGDSVSLSDVCNTVSDAINVEISVSISEVGLSANCTPPKPVDDFTSSTEVSNTVQSKILLGTNASNGDSSSGMDTSENPIASELDLCPISSSSTDVNSEPVSSSVCSMSSESNSASVSNSVPISTSKVQSSSSENIVASVCSSTSASVAIVSRSPSEQPSSGSTKLKKSVDPVSKATSSPKKSVVTTSATTCASATQKRKVSLSEYRLRMKESPSKNRPAETIANAKKNNILSISTAVSLDTTYEKQLSLAPLRLKSDSKATASALQQNKSKKTPKPKETVADADEISKTMEKPQETLKERLSLMERLKREFGLEDDPEEEKSSPIPVHVSQPKSLPTSVPSSIKMAPVLSMVAQQPPPPPPPPRLPRATLPPPVTPFNYPLTAPFARPPFIVPQVQSNPYINHQPPMTAAAHPSLHHQLATPHSMLPMMPPYSAISGGAANLRPQVPPRDYATSVNAQNFASLVQPPPNPQGYHPMYQAGYFK